MIENMTLEEMRTYLGRQEVPADFDEFWERELEQHERLPKLRWNEREFHIPNVNCLELTFETENQSTIYAKCAFPKTNKKVPVVFIFHGYQGRSPDWSQILNYITAGYGAVCMDVRGQAGQSTDMGRFEGITVKGQVIRGMTSGREHLFYKDIYMDVYRIIEIVAGLDFVDGENLVTFGASQGGALALVGAALNPRIKRCVSIYPFLSDFKRVLELGDDCEAYNELFRYFKFMDPFHDTQERVLDVLSYIDVKNFAHRIICPVYLIVGMQDSVCPPSTQFAIYNRLAGEKEMKILPEYRHEAMEVKIQDYIFDKIVGTSILG